MATFSTSTELSEFNVSESSQISEFSIGKPNETGDDERLKWNRVILVVGFLLLGCFAAAGVILLTVEIGPGELSTTEGDGKDGDVDGKRVPRVFEGVFPTLNHVTTSAATTETDAEEIERAEPVPRNFVVCTVNGEGPSLATLKYPVNLCNIAFFDSLYKEVRREVSATFSQNVASFLNWPTTYPDGEFGVSFSLWKGVLKQKLLDSQLEPEIKDRFRKGIRHAAVINIYGDGVTPDGFTVALDVLKTAYKTYLKFKSTKHSYVVLGAAIDDWKKRRLVSLMDHFVPSLFISIAQLSYDDRARHDCRILPPTRLSTSIPGYIKLSDIKYGRTLEQSCGLLSEVTRAGIQVPMAISFSLSGRLYKPQLSNRSSTYIGDLELFRPCEDFDGEYFVSPGQLCKSGTQWFTNVRKKRTSDTFFTFDNVTKRTLTFDDVETMKKKVCETKSSCQGEAFGLAAYDIEYDALNINCGRAVNLQPFQRVAFLRNMSGYLNGRTLLLPFNKTVCLAI